MKRLLSFLLIFSIAAAVSAQVKVNCGPYLQNVTEDSFTVVWTTDGPAVGWIELAPDDGTNFYNVERPKYQDARGMGRKPIDTFHKVTVKGLKPGTTYRYRVMCRGVISQENRARIIYDEGYGLDLKKRPTKVTTKALEYDSVKFGVVNDMHEGDSLVQVLFKDAKGKYDFVCFNGDMTSAVDSVAEIRIHYMKSASKLFASDTPLYLCRGNHEYRGNDAVKYLDYLETSTGKTYYTVSYGKYFFLFLDSGEDKADSDIRNLDIMVTEDYVAEEAEWLKGVVESEEYKNASKRIVFCHIPPYADGWHGNVMASKFVQILNGTGVDLMLCAHIHKYRFHEAGTIGADFPVLCNANRQRIDAVVDSRGIRLDIFDASGTKLHSHKF
jgi:acid phosphatase type 7